MTPEVVLHINHDDLQSGFIRVEKATRTGRQIGQMPVREVTKLLKGVAQVEIETRQVHLINRFAKSEFVAFGANGAKWVAVKEIPPAEFFLVSVSQKAYKVKVPRLVVRVGNYESPYFFWTEDEQLTLESKLYPLVIGNINTSGWVCLGSTGLKCKNHDDIDAFVRKAIEAPSTGTYLSKPEEVDKFFAGLAEKWDPEIGRKHGITVQKLLSMPTR